MNNPYFIVERVGEDTEVSYNKYPEFQVWEEGKMAGMKEVAEWVNAHLHDSEDRSYTYCFGGGTWRDKLRAWGIYDKGEG